MATILVIPGLSGSGAEHWQTVWERLDARCVRVEQRDWEAPVCTEWCARLEEAVTAAHDDVVLVAHSLGCLLVAHWAYAGSVERIKGALLVAPPDVECAERTPEVTRDFAPIPREALPFESILVASRDDSFASIEFARELAEAWGARFVDAGELGHINADSKLGTWEAGRVLLDELLRVKP
jgi:uncharacterized protein